MVREKLAAQKKDSRKGLSTLLAKTHPSRPVAGKVDLHGVYTGEQYAQSTEGLMYVYIELSFLLS